MKLLGLRTSGPGDLWLAEGTAASVADYADLALWSPGPVQAAVIRALGANPVNLAAPEFREALETEVIDCLLTVSTALATHDLTDVL